MNTKRSHFLIAAIVGLSASIFVLIISFIFSGLFTAWEDKTADYRLKLRGKIDTHPDIVLIDIDDSSMQAIGRWPWDRAYHGKMIDILSASKAAAIGYDILFDHPVEGEGDRVLINATSSAKDLLYPVGFALQDKPVESIGTPDSRPSAGLPEKFTIVQDISNPGRIFSVERTVPPFAGLLTVTGGMGHISSNRDTDGTIRRVPLVVNLNGRFFPAFGLSVVASYLKVPNEDIVINPGSYITLKNAMIPGHTAKRNIHIPIDDRGMMVINYAGRWEDTFTHYSFVDILKEADKKDGLEGIGEILSGKIALISNTATGYDLKPVSIEDNFPGGGIHANIINTILTENFLRRLSIPGRILILIASGIAAAWIAINRRWKVSLLSCCLVVGAYWILSYILLLWTGFITDMFSPTVVMFLSFTTATLYGKGVEQERSTQLFTELELLGKSIKSMTGDLSAKEDELLRLRQELSERVSSAGMVMGQEEVSSRRIASLEVKMEETLREKVLLLRSKQQLEMKLARLLTEPSHSDLQLPDGLDELRKECARYGIITRSPRVLKIFEDIKKAAQTRSPVLILGESGTGKELFARAVHELSPRSVKPLIVVDTPAVSDNLFESELFGHVRGAFTGAVSDRKGYFEAAQGGTLFLDEIGDLSTRIQAGLLGVLQRHEFRKVGSATPIKTDVRIITATNKNLVEETAKGSFREDLYYRLNVVSVVLPPLRERPEDIEPLVHYFLGKYCAENGLKYGGGGNEKGDIKGLTPSAIERLKSHTWKGNIRELENVIARSVTMSKGGWITEEDMRLDFTNDTPPLNPLPQGEGRQNGAAIIPPPLTGGGEGEGEAQPLDAIRDEDFLSVLRKKGFNIGDTAKVFNISRGTAAHRFKGICFETLVRYNGDIQKASFELSGSSFAYIEVVKERVEEYYTNLIEVIKHCDSIEDAMSECRRRFKNLKGRYFRAMEELVRMYFDGKDTV
ncbi:MAG: sigma 54-interacting transcriptional regulator [Nitrospirae bacterium]|nr:sigma 54-interacting transcriptional regulator [Nitrospirota bacterium]